MHFFYTQIVMHNDLFKTHHQQNHQTHTKKNSFKWHLMADVEYLLDLENHILITLIVHLAVKDLYYDQF